MARIANPTTSSAAATQITPRTTWPRRNAGTPTASKTPMIASVIAYSGRALPVLDIRPTCEESRPRFQQSAATPDNVALGQWWSNDHLDAAATRRQYHDSHVEPRDVLLELWILIRRQDSSRPGMAKPTRGASPVRPLS
jgi:hypothetical protein